MSLYYFLSWIGFPLLTLIFYGLFFLQLKAAIERTAWSSDKKQKCRNKIVVGFILWGIVVSVASLLGFTGNFSFFPLNAMPLLAIPLITTLILLFTSATKDILTQISIESITILQVFRVFVEIILWLLFIQNLLPEQMTFEGRNWDILAGLSALLAARFFVKRKSLMIAWNIFGLALLINIVTIALLSMPTPFRYFHNEPSNTLVTHFPFIFLPTFLVPLAYILHLLSLRKLFMKP